MPLPDSNTPFLLCMLVFLRSETLGDKRQLKNKPKQTLQGETEGQSIICAFHITYLSYSSLCLQSCTFSFLNAEY